MPRSATSRPKLQEQRGFLRVALGHGTRAFLLSFAVVVLGGGPSSPLVPSFSSISSSTAAPRFGFVVAAAATLDTAVAAAEHASTNQQAQAEKGEERGLYSSYDERSSSAGRALGLERNLASSSDDPSIVELKELEFDDPINDVDSGSEISVLLEGCTIPAESTSVQVKHDKPTSGNIADNAIDGDPMTW